MAKRSLTWVLLMVLLLVAAGLRFYGLNWDGGLGAHPDERYIVGVAEGLRWPDRLNPFAIAPDYTYGHWPLYLLALVHALIPGVDALLLGRALAALFDVGTVFLTFALGREVSGERVGLLAAAFVALMVAHVQQAHFYTVDVLLAFFVVGALLFAVRLAEGGAARDAWLAGASVGLALSTKISTALLLIPLGAACALRADERERHFWRCGLAALMAFALTNPFALLALPTFWRNVAKQAAIVRGALDVPYIRQYHGTWSYLYPIVQQMRWGMGWALGLAAFGGLIYAVWMAAGPSAMQEPPRRAEWVLLAWVLPTFAFVGALYAKFPRYLLPLAPILAIYAARLLCSLAPLLPCPSAPLFLCLLLRCLAFASIYRTPHPWQAASAWLYERAEPGATIAVEQWDHPLPLDATGYDVRELPVFDEETPEKWAAMESVLAQADYVVIASRRGYAALAYPRMTRYYRRLFERELGFEPAACFGRHPRLGPLALVDRPAKGLDVSLPTMCRPKARLVLGLGRLDESFVVYDHPVTLILDRIDP